LSTFKLKPRHSLYRKNIVYYSIYKHRTSYSEDRIDENKQQQQQQRYTCIKVKKKQNKQKNKKYEFLFHLQYWFMALI
jgi:hypothetical protein